MSIVLGNCVAQSLELIWQRMTLCILTIGTVQLQFSIEHEFTGRIFLFESSKLYSEGISLYLLDILSVTLNLGVRLRPFWLFYGPWGLIEEDLILIHRVARLIHLIYWTGLIKLSNVFSESILLIVIVWSLMNLVLWVFVTEFPNIIIELVSSFVMLMSFILINLKFFCEISLHKSTQEGPLRTDLQLHNSSPSLDIVN